MIRTEKLDVPLNDFIAFYVEGYTKVPRETIVNWEYKLVENGIVELTIYVDDDKAVIPPRKHE